MIQNPSLVANPLVSQWLDFHEPGVVTARTGKVELGQGITTALAQVVADALGVDPHVVAMRPASTAGSPDEGFTAGSMSIPHSGDALRRASATALRLLRARAAELLGCPESDLRVEDGSFHRGSTSVGYWTVAMSTALDVPVDVEGAPGTPRPTSERTSLPRIDLADKVFGRPRFLHDLRLPDMVFGRVVHPPGRGSTLSAVDRSVALGIRGVLAVVVDGSFLGVVADSERTALEAAAALAAAATWSPPRPDLSDATVHRFLRAAPTVDTPIAVDELPADRPDTIRFRATYSRPFIAHASMAPSCAAAVWDAATALTVWSHSQGIYPLRRDIARAVGLPEAAVTVQHVEGAGCYGHNAADDVAYDAALLARAVPGRPVHVTWSRESELSWAPFGAAMVVDLDTSADGSGTITGWRYDAWGNGHSSRPGTLASPSMLAAELQAGGAPVPPSHDPPEAAGWGIGRNGVPAYRVGALSATTHRALEMPVRASALRSLGAHLNVFAIESHLDDMAHHFGVDPLEYRLRHLDDPRARAVLERVAELSDWSTPVRGDSTGRGIGFARYKNKGAWCAVVAELVAESRVELRSLWVAVDVGAVVDHDGVVNQIEGGAIQAASWTLKEQVGFDAGVVTTATWDRYPILTFSEVPAVRVEVLDRPEQPSLGAGEASMGPTAAAIGNALRAAIGVRVRDLPLTAEHVVAAMTD